MSVTGWESRNPVNVIAGFLVGPSVKINPTNILIYIQCNIKLSFMQSNKFVNLKKDGYFIIGLLISIFI